MLTRFCDFWYCVFRGLFGHVSNVHASFQFRYQLHSVDQIYKSTFCRILHKRQQLPEGVLCHLFLYSWFPPLELCLYLLLMNYYSLKELRQIHAGCNTILKWIFFLVFICMSSKSNGQKMVFAKRRFEPLVVIDYSTGSYHSLCENRKKNNKERPSPPFVTLKLSNNIGTFWRATSNR